MQTAIAADPIYGLAGFEFDLLRLGTPFLRHQQTGLVLLIFVRLGGERRKRLLHLLELGSLHDRVRFLGQEHDFTLRVHHALVKRGVRAEPAHAPGVAFFRGDFVKEANEAAGVIPAVPRVLNAELVGIQYAWNSGYDTSGFIRDRKSTRLNSS